MDTLTAAATAIIEEMRTTELALIEKYPVFGRKVPEKLFCITAQELLDRYPNLSPKEREDAICQEYGAVLLMQIGGKLSHCESHDCTAPVYDDWHVHCYSFLWHYT